MGCSQGIQTHPTSSSIDQIRNKNKNNNYRRRSIDMADQILQKIELLPKKLNDEQLKFAVEKLSEHQLFSTLKKQELRAICEEMVSATAESQKYIFNQGDTGVCFFLIYRGQVDVQIDKKYVRTLKQGQTFGQLALLFRCARTASIICREPNCIFLIMKPALYKSTLRKMRLQEYSRNVQTIQKVPLFSCLTNKQKFSLASYIKEMVFGEGDTIFSSGDDAQTMYIISEGKVRIEISGKKDILLNEGEIFGEASLHENMKRSGNAKAIGKVICSILSKRDIENTLGSSINNLIHYNIKKWALLRSPIFKNLDSNDLNKFIIEFQVIQFADDSTIDTKEYPGFIVCLQGKINNMVQGKIFNEEAWLNRSFKGPDLQKNGDGLIGFLSFKKTEQLFEEIKCKQKLLKAHKSDRSKDKFDLSDFLYLKKLGEGQFGQVFLVKNTHYGTNLFAIKCLSKEQIKKQQLEESVIQQRKILQKTIFPYIVGYVKAFHSKKHIFLLMQYIHGKEMFDVIREVKNMKIEMVKYYFACLLISVEYLHANSIVYRDLKPENSVVDYHGKVYLIDMGTAKELIADKFYKTFTIIGTPHYMAPEMFEGNGYSFEVDIWSMGCLLYEFMCYGVPFGENLSDPYAIYSSIKKSNLTFPKFVKDEKVKKLINSLLTKNPKLRSQLTFQKIKKHEFFKQFNWTKLLEQQMEAPYIPKDFKVNNIQQVENLKGENFLKYFYSKGDKYADVEEWNQDI